MIEIGRMDPMPSNGFCHTSCQDLVVGHVKLLLKNEVNKFVLNTKKLLKILEMYQSKVKYLDNT